MTFEWHKATVEPQLQETILDLNKFIVADIGDLWDGEGECTFAQFNLKNLKIIRERLSTMRFEGDISYVDVFRHPSYVSRYGIRGHKEHNTLRLILDQKKILQVNRPSKNCDPSWHYSFGTVKKESFVAWMAPSTTLQHISGIDFFCHWESSIPLVRKNMVIEPHVIDELYIREQNKSREAMRTMGFRNPSVYNNHDWYSALYSYTEHDRYVTALRSMVQGDVLVVCDAISLLGYPSTDLYPSKYALGPVKQESVSSVLKRWTTETLVICFGATFLNDNDRGIINASASPVIVLDVVPIYFTGMVEYGEGLTARGVTRIPFIHNTEIHEMTTPLYTENLLSCCNTNRKHYIVSEGKALAYIIQMRPNIQLVCNDEMFAALQHKGVKVTKELYNVKDHMLIIENLEQWLRLPHTGYLVPAGRENTPIVALRKPLKMYNTRTIYRVGQESIIYMMQEMGVSISISYTDKSAHFIFPREVVSSHFIVREGVGIKNLNYILQEWSDQIVVYTSLSFGIPFTTLNKQSFISDLRDAQMLHSKADYARILETLRTTSNQNVQNWIIDHG